jgi:hypothetical protein
MPFKDYTSDGASTSMEAFLVQLLGSIKLVVEQVCLNKSAYIE